MSQPGFHCLTFGCQMNVNDSRWVARALVRRGFAECPLEKADVVFLNTCSVREKPELKVDPENDVVELGGERLGHGRVYVLSFA